MAEHDDRQRGSRSRSKKHAAGPAERKRPRDTLIDQLELAETYADLLLEPIDHSDAVMAKNARLARRAFAAARTMLDERKAQVTSDEARAELGRLEARWTEGYAATLTLVEYYANLAPTVSSTCAQATANPEEVTGEPAAALDTLSLTAFNSAYNKAVAKWGFVAQAQNNGIESVYTEAKKPKKPDLVTDLLIALAMAALGGTVNVIGTVFLRAIEKEVAAQLTKHLVFEADGSGGGKWIQQLSKDIRRVFTDDEAKAVREMAASTAKYLGELGKDAFKDGVKTLIGPAIRAGLQEGKKPLDAFFEAQKATTVDAAQQASSALEEHRTSVLACNPDPVIVARAVSKAMEAHYQEAREIQKDHTLGAWLSYQAQSALGVVGARVNADGSMAYATNLAAMPDEVGGYVGNNVAGVVSVDLYLTPGTLPGFQLIGGSLPGLSAPMLARLKDKPLVHLGLPIVFRFVGDLHGRGYRSPPSRNYTPIEHQFNIRMNEAGHIWVDAPREWHRKALVASLGGDPDSPEDLERNARVVTSWAHGLTLADLRVKADKE